MVRSRCFVPLLAVPTALFGQTPPVSAGPGGAPVDAVPSLSGTSALDRLALALSLTSTSDYFFRGIVQRADSLNLQPAAHLSFLALDAGDTSLSLFAGLWGSFSDDRASGHRSGPREYWYEQDAYAGVSLSVDRFTLDAAYTWYFSPASDFTEVEDITLAASFDDAGLWDAAGRFSMNPSASIAFETRNAASGPDSGVWLGLGLTPTVPLGDSFLGPMTLSFPMEVGVSLDNYYQRSDGSSDAFGYSGLGATLTFDMGERFGDAAPTLDMGVKHLLLGGVLDDLNAGHSGETAFTIGLGWSF